MKYDSSDLNSDRAYAIHKYLAMILIPWCKIIKKIKTIFNKSINISEEILSAFHQANGYILIYVKLSKINEYEEQRTYYSSIMNMKWPAHMPKAFCNSAGEFLKTVIKSTNYR